MHGVFSQVHGGPARYEPLAPHVHDLRHIGRAVLVRKARAGGAHLLSGDLLAAQNLVRAISHGLGHHTQVTGGVPVKDPGVAGAIALTQLRGPLPGSAVHIVNAVLFVDHKRREWQGGKQSRYELERRAVILLVGGHAEAPGPFRSGFSAL